MPRVTITDLPDKRTAIDFGPPGPFIALTQTQLAAMLVAIRNSGKFEPFPVRRA